MRICGTLVRIDRAFLFLLNQVVSSSPSLYNLFLPADGELSLASMVNHRSMDLSRFVCDSFHDLNTMQPRLTRRFASSVTRIARPFQDMVNTCGEYTVFFGPSSASHMVPESSTQICLVHTISKSVREFITHIVTNGKQGLRIEPQIWML